VTIIFSTFSQNTAGGFGGAIDNYFAGSIVNVQDSILAGDSAPTGPEVNSGVNSQGHNLVGNTQGSYGWKSSDHLNPLKTNLGKLGNYGGPTQTVALLRGSPAIGNGIVADYPGTHTLITTDQRGRPRVIPPDIGAFQFTSGRLRMQVNTTAIGKFGKLDLRGAIDLANVLPGGHTITFSPTVFAGPRTSR
jgi:hypothetical protein